MDDEEDGETIPSMGGGKRHPGECVRVFYDGLMDHKKLWAVPGRVVDTQGWDVSAWEKNGKLNVLYFSFLSEAKGVYTAFSAARKVLVKSPEVRFVFVGPVESDEVRKELDALCEQFPDNAQYLGYVDDAGKRTACFRNADIFIFPTHRECFGLVLLHAMAERLPVIASIEGAIPEVIREGENGFLVNKGDDEQLLERIFRLINDRSLREAMGQANRQRYLKFYSL